MTNKQMMALIYAIDAYLADIDYDAITAIGRGEYFRGVRNGASEVVEGVTKIMRKYHFNPKKARAERNEADI